jgi:hypothetical protein
MTRRAPPSVSGARRTRQAAVLGDAVADPQMVAFTDLLAMVQFIWHEHVGHCGEQWRDELAACCSGPPDQHHNRDCERGLNTSLNRQRTRTPPPICVFGPEPAKTASVFGVNGRNCGVNRSSQGVSRLNREAKVLGRGRVISALWRLCFSCEGYRTRANTHFHTLCSRDNAKPAPLESPTAKTKFLGTRPRPAAATARRLVEGRILGNWVRPQFNRTSGFAPAEMPGRPWSPSACRQTRQPLFKSGRRSARRLPMDVWTENNRYFQWTPGHFRLRRFPNKF